MALTDREDPPVKKGRKRSTSKLLVAVAVELLEPKGFGRIRLRRIPKASAQYLIPFVQESIKPGAQVRTDGAGVYKPVKDLGYNHKRTVMFGSKVPAHVSMAGVHRVAALVKRWILGCTTDRYSPNTWTPNSTNSSFASTAEPRVHAACCSTGYYSRPWSPPL